jgi:hypothetical protein
MGQRSVEGRCTPKRSARNRATRLAAPAFTVPGLDRTRQRDSRREKRADEAAHLRAATAPAVNEQHGRSTGRSRLPDRDRMPSGDDPFRTRSAETGLRP